MSVLIKGMEMPENCAECKFLCSENFNSWCQVTDRDDVYTDAIPDWCPLVELPEKHGKLVDADALIAKYGDWYTEEGKEEGFIGTLEMLIKDAPTVVEAEGEK